MKLIARSRGIVLQKHFPRRLSLVLIDELHGHMRVVPDGWQWADYACVGALINYDLFCNRGAYFIKHVELIAVPVYANELSVFFAHHVFELCSLCLPLHDKNEECFLLLLHIITALEQLANDSGLQKMTLAKLLVVLGQQTHEGEQLAVSSALYRPYCDLLTMSFDEEQQHELGLFIFHAINSHPYGRLLKTINFLERVGS
jgi:hypothetical protein